MKELKTLLPAGHNSTGGRAGSARAHNFGRWPAVLSQSPNLRAILAEVYSELKGERNLLHMYAYRLSNNVSYTKLNYF